MSKLWKFKPCDEALAEELFHTLEDIPRPLAALLAQRGCKTAEELEEFMNSSLGALRDPFELPDMDKAVERIWRALTTGEKITVFGDYDADGICSTALLTRVLRALGGDVEAFIPNRLDDGYGFSSDSLATCIEQYQPTLIVTVDCGTNSADSVEKAKELGVDVVITDHHEPDSSIADAVAVVNPKRVENHPDSILAGVGVAFKLCHALVKAGRDADRPSAALIDLKDYLDFVAVATVTDMVPLLGENRILVRAGFQALENSKWAGWNALKKLAGVTGTIETAHAGFTFGPRINAAGRIGRADAALELFLTDLPARADEQARFLDAANRERQDIEKEIVREAFEEIDATFDETKDFGIVIAREGWHIGVIGIVASRLVQRYGRPVAVIGMDGDCGRGSCRSIDAFNLLDGLNACSGLLKQFGGHAMAAGLELELKNLEAFKEQFNAYAAGQLKGNDLQPVLEIDCAIQLAEADAALMDGLKRAGPFGQDNPEPVWAILGVNVADSRILKEKHLKLALSDGNTRIDAIGFNMAEKLPAGPVDIAFTLQENSWNGRTTLQLNLKDLRPAGH
ncbi:MAG: single-stranded-DNA-specific exonuclease RecJ [Verrucomicrobia bacterium]|nr:single-stranded-DNA-specific exonuclease RecJ [Verrucomicrobiota bacterium]